MTAPPRPEGVGCDTCKEWKDWAEYLEVRVLEMSGRIKALNRENRVISECHSDEIKRRFELEEQELDRIHGPGRRGKM